MIVLVNIKVKLDYFRLFIKSYLTSFSPWICVKLFYVLFLEFVSDFSLLMYCFVFMPLDWFIRLHVKFSIVCVTLSMFSGYSFLCDYWKRLVGQNSKIFLLSFLLVSFYLIFFINFLFVSFYLIWFIKFSTCLFY